MTNPRFARRSLGIGIVLLLAAGVTYASIPGSDGAIHACYLPGGQLRLIDADANQSCRPGETAIQWPAVSQGCPAGTLPFLGVCIEIAARSPDFHFFAALDCADELRRLPSPGELKAFREVDGITLSVEWTDDLADAAEPFRFVVVSESGDGVATVDEEHVYRCVAGPVLQ
jgi:hypothetical protein